MTFQRTSLILVAVLAATLFSVTSHARQLSPEQQRAVLDEAQAAYEKGIAIVRDDPAQAREHFRNAADRFALVAKSPDNPHGIANGRLLFNLANAHLQAGDLGKAILNYRRAEKLIPTDVRLAQNLAHARTLSRSQIEASAPRALTDAVLGWHDRTPLRWRVFGLLLVNALFFAGLLIRMKSAGSRWWQAILGIIWLALAASVAADFTGFGSRSEGVLVADDVIVRKGNGVGYEPAFEQPLHAGVEFAVLQQRNEWMHIELANGEDGWIESKHAALVP